MKEDKGIKLLKNTVVFEKLDADIAEDTKTAGGLYVPKEVLQAKASREFRKGKVISCGLECTIVKVGCTIFYVDTMEKTVVMDGVEMTMISEDQIFAIR